MARIIASSFAIGNRPPSLAALMGAPGGQISRPRFPERVPEDISSRTVSIAPARAQAPLVSVPDRCILCGGAQLALRYPARGDRQPDARAYACTSFGHRSHGPIWACGECGLLLQWPRPSERELVGAYGDVEDPVYLAEKANRYLTFRRALRILGPAAGRRLRRPDIL